MRKNSNRAVKPLILVTSFFCLIAFGLIIAKILKKPTPQSSAIHIIDTRKQPTLGNPKAQVHVVIFEDLKCPICAQLNARLFPIIKKYTADGTISYTIIPLAFIPGSIPAAKAALCLLDQENQKNPKEDYFFPFIDYVYRNQPDETEDWATPSRLLDFARKSIPTLSISDSQALAHCISGSQSENRYTARLANNLKIAEKTMGEDKVATPTLYINGKPVIPLTVENVEAMIKKEKAQSPPH